MHYVCFVIMFLNCKHTLFNRSFNACWVCFKCYICDVVAYMFFYTATKNCSIDPRPATNC